MSILFHDIVFGPVKSRRLGVSLGINLLPVDYKFCTFNCVYCECGWTRGRLASGHKLPTRRTVYKMLEEKLKEMSGRQMFPDAITFAGNGEPTIHPEFPGIMDDTLVLRDKYFPDAAVTVLSNSSTLGKPAVLAALKKADKNVLKLDAGTDEMFRLINNPRPGISLNGIVKGLKSFGGKLIIQTLFLRGQYNNQPIDNTGEPELSRWLDLVKEIKPEYVMIYPIARKTALPGIEKISFAELKQIAARVGGAGIKTQVYS
jgi:wyosine [tRNA(Phe)-imidazoG37] synthetase (radical SAM superfamily)